MSTVQELEVLMAVKLNFQFLWKFIYVNFMP